MVQWASVSLGPGCHLLCPAHPHQQHDDSQGGGLTRGGGQGVCLCFGGPSVWVEVDIFPWPDPIL